MPRETETVLTPVRPFDVAAARRYLRDVEALAIEGYQSSDHCVLLGALRILARQGATVQELLGAAAGADCSSMTIPEIGCEPFNLSPADIEAAWRTA